MTVSPFDKMFNMAFDLPGAFASVTAPTVTTKYEHCGRIIKDKEVKNQFIYKYRSKYKS